MTAREAIESTYYDSFSSFRKVNRKNGAITVQSEEKILENKPCALSHGSGKALVMPNGLGQTEEIYTLFHAPDLDVKPGDKITVTNPGGQTFNCVAGKPFAYASHAETPCKEEART